MPGMVTARCRSRLISAVIRSPSGLPRDKVLAFEDAEVVEDAVSAARVEDTGRATTDASAAAAR